MPIYAPLPDDEQPDQPQHSQHTPVVGLPHIENIDELLRGAIKRLDSPDGLDDSDILTRVPDETTITASRRRWTGITFPVIVQRSTYTNAAGQHFRFTFEIEQSRTAELAAPQSETRGALRSLAIQWLPWQGVRSGETGVHA